MYNNETNYSTHQTVGHSSVFYAVTLSSSLIIAISSPVAVVGNALVLAAIWRNPSLRTPSYILLAGLAFTDLCTGLITQPFYVAQALINLIDPDMKSIENGKMFILFKVLAYACVTLFTNMTLLIITFMSIERWLHMTRRSLITVRRACFIAVFIFFFTIPIVVNRAIYMYNIKEAPRRFISDVFSISIVLFCLTVTSAAYFKVFRIIRRHQQQIHANGLSQNVAQPAINFEKYKKSVFSILYILAVFYVGFIPVIIFLGLHLMSKNQALTLLLLHVLMVFVFLSSSLNPLLYLWRMKDIRNEVKQLVKRILCLDT